MATLAKKPLGGTQICNVYTCATTEAQKGTFCGWTGIARIAIKIIIIIIMAICKAPVSAASDAHGASLQIT